MFTSSLAILIGWILIGNVLRWSIVDLSHSVSHREMFRKSQWKGRLIAEFFSVLFITHSLEDYKSSHMPHHDPRVTFTSKDDDFKLLFQLGFKPAMSVKQLKKHFYTSLISPRFHWCMFNSRLRSNLGLGNSKTGKLRRLASIIWLSLLLYFAIFISLPVVLIAYVIPVILIANCSALAQFSTEHRWLATSDQSWGRMIGEPAPHSYIDWLIFWFKLVFLWIPLRLIWVAGSLSSHDAHHLAGSKFDPFNPVYSRAELLAKGKPMTETWGFDEALTRAMTSISQADHLTS